MKEKILVVDDEKDILELVEYNLAKNGYRVKTVTSGEEALERLFFRPRSEVQKRRGPENHNSQDTEHHSLNPAPAAFFARSVGVQIARHTLT